MSIAEKPADASMRVAGVETEQAPTQPFAPVPTAPGERKLTIEERMQPFSETREDRIGLLVNALSGELTNEQLRIIQARHVAGVMYGEGIGPESSYVTHHAVAHVAELALQEFTEAMWLNVNGCDDYDNI